MQTSKKEKQMETKEISVW